MRLFAALAVPAEVRDALAERTTALRSLEWPVRWVRPEGIHLTLKFFGDVEPDRRGMIPTALGEAMRGTGPLALVVTGLGLMPLRRPRVIFAALDAPPALELLQNRVERAAAALGFAVDGRTFRPHLTLARVRDGAALPSGARERLEDEPIELPFLANRVVLYESHLGPGGAQYVERSTFTLEH